MTHPLHSKSFEAKYIRFDVSYIKRHWFLCVKENSGTKRTFGLITHCYLVNRYLRFLFMIAECK